MIVDDEKLLRNGFRHMADWNSKGIQIISEAINGKDALEKLKEVHPDVVLTDINMPVMNGIELTKEIKKIYPYIIVIILSGYDDYDYIRESMKNGASDYLLKASIDVDDLCEMLQKLKIQENLFPIVSEMSAEEYPLDFDKTKVLQFLETLNFDDLKSYITILISNNSSLPIEYIQELLRDLFFFIQFQLDHLKLLSKYLKTRKYINSTSITLINDHVSAVEWIQLIIDEIAKSCSATKPVSKIKIENVLEIIKSDFKEPNLSLSSIADRLYMNKNYLCDIFKSETNTTINQYIADIRINEAKKLMRTTNKSLYTISEIVGYADYNYFSRVFKKKMGIPPSEYYKMYSK